MEIGECVTNAHKIFEGEIRTLRRRNPLKWMFGYDHLQYHAQLEEIKNSIHSYLGRLQSERDRFNRMRVLANRSEKDHIQIKGLANVEKLDEWLTKEIEREEQKIQETHLEEKKEKVKEALTNIRCTVSSYAPELLGNLDKAVIKAVEGDTGKFKELIKQMRKRGKISREQESIMIGLMRRISIHPYKKWKTFCAILGALGLTGAIVGTGGLAAIGGVAAVGSGVGMFSRRRKIEGESVSNTEMRGIYRSIEMEKQTAFHPENPTDTASINGFFDKLNEGGTGQTMVVETSPGRYERYHIVNFDEDGGTKNIVLRKSDRPYNNYIVLDYSNSGSLISHYKQGTNPEETGDIVIDSRRNAFNQDLRVDGRITKTSPFLPYISIVTPVQREAQERADKVREVGDMLARSLSIGNEAYASWDRARNAVGGNTNTQITGKLSDTQTAYQALEAAYNIIHTGNTQIQTPNLAIADVRRLHTEAEAQVRIVEQKRDEVLRLEREIDLLLHPSP